jgi:hypothetical protein
MNTLISTLSGATAMASLVAALLFLRFWRQSRDPLFITFAIAFAIEAATRVVLGLQISTEYEPLYYVPRLITFALIILGIAQKNWRRG